MKIFKAFVVPWVVTSVVLFPIAASGDLTLVQELTFSIEQSGGVKKAELEEQEDEATGTLQDLEEELKDLKVKLSTAKSNVQKKRLHRDIEELEQLIAQRKQDLADSQSLNVQSEGHKEQVTIYLSGNRLRFDAGEIISIVDLDKNRLLNLMPESKTYYEMTFEEWDKMQKRMEEVMGKPPADKQRKLTPKDIQVVHTENRQKVNGFECEQYIITDQMGSDEVWVTKDVEFKEYNALMKKYSNLMMRANPDMQRELEKLQTIEGIPVKIISKSPYSTEITEVKRISTDKLDPALFQVPQGFQKSRPETKTIRK